MDDDRRLLGRITPRATLAGQIGHTPVRIVDISLRGSRVTHTEPLPIGTECVLSFKWQDCPIEASCEIVRSRFAPSRTGQPMFHTGLRIIGAVNGSGALLRQLICWHVTRALDAQIADAHGLPPSADFDPEPVEDVYIRCEFIRGVWRRITTSSREQPTLGFTVRANEPHQNIDRLCDTYLVSDGATRQLIQRMAAASLECEPVAPHRSYMP